MTNIHNQPPDEPQWEPSTPDPTWQPRDAEDVQGLYGPEAAKAWLDASDERRRGIIRQLLTNGTPTSAFVEPIDEYRERKRIEEENDAKMLEVQDLSEEQFVAEIEASYKRHNEILAKTFVPNPDFLESIRQNRGKFASLRQGVMLMIPVYEARLQGELTPKERMKIERALRATPDAIVKYTVRIHMLDCLLEGALTMDDCMARVAADPTMANLDAGDRKNIYTLYAERLIEMKQILASSPDA